MTQLLKERDKNLINNWYIGCLSSELKPNTALRRIIYDMPIAIFRDKDQKPAALLDRCVHRGAQLSLGYCDEGHLRCPYHGWKYDPQGHVVEIPSEGQGHCRGKHQQRSFPVVEQDGAIWIWMGESAPLQETPPWRFPNQKEKYWCHYFMITDFENEVTHLVENFMDVPHTVFVHSGWFRDRQMTPVPMTVDVQNGQVNVTYHQPQDSIGYTRFLINPLNQPMTHTDRFIYPNLTRVDYNFGTSSSFIINSQCTPVSTMKSRVYTYIAFKALNYAVLLKPLMQFYTRRVIEQDVEIMKNQGDNLKMFPDTPFRSSDADELHLAIEKIRRYGSEGQPEVFTFTKTSEKQFWI